jgi:hypothetical protein
VFEAFFKLVKPYPFPFPISAQHSSSPAAARFLFPLLAQLATAVAHRFRVAQPAQIAAASPTPPPHAAQPMTGGPHLSSPSLCSCPGRTRPSLTRRRLSPPPACVPVRGPHTKGSLSGYLRRRHPLGPLIQTLATSFARARAAAEILAPRRLFFPPSPPLRRRGAAPELRKEVRRTWVTLVFEPELHVDRMRLLELRHRSAAPCATAPPHRASSPSRLSRPRRPR